MWVTRTFMLQVNASEAIRENLKLNCCELICFNLMLAERAGKIEMNYREESERTCFGKFCTP